jgi:hypothetical protein
MEDTAPLTTRREFAKTAALAAAVPLLAGLGGCATAPPAPPPAPTPEAAPAAPPAPATATAPPAAAARAPNPVAVALTQALREKYGSRLTEEQWDQVREGIEGNLQSARALHDFALPISTEPAFAFRPYRGGER